MAAPAGLARRSGVFHHARELLARELVSHVGVRAADVLLRVVQHLVLRLAADRLATGAVDHLRHPEPPRALGALSSEVNSVQAARASRSSASRAAACSASFFERPVPTPASSPSITAAHVNVRSCGGPATSRTL